MSGGLIDSTEMYLRTVLELAEDRTVALTAEGRDIATHVMRKHRLAERLLVDVLGVEPEHVHAEACRWEHVISDRVEAKLVEFLGNPSTSPYGNPIPGTPAADCERLTLADATGARVRIERISERLQANHDVMHALEELGVHAGDEVAVDRRDGGIQLSSSGTTTTLDDDSARLLYVSEV